jgi:hypothetical protein
VDVSSGSYAVLLAVPDWPTILGNWIRILYLCAGLLLIETLLILILGWARRLSWRLRLGALAPLAVSVAAVVAARYIDGMYFGGWVIQQSPIPSLQEQIIAGFNDSIRKASVLGWIGIGLTSILLVLGLVSAFRWPAGPGKFPVTPAAET